MPVLLVVLEYDDSHKSIRIRRNE